MSCRFTHIQPRRNIASGVGPCAKRRPRTKGKKDEIMGDDNSMQSDINNQEERPIPCAMRQQPDRSKEKERVRVTMAMTMTMTMTMNMIDDGIPRRKFASTRYHAVHPRFSTCQAKSDLQGPQPREGMLCDFKGSIILPSHLLLEIMYEICK
jgi:hypothetical protein